MTVENIFNSYYENLNSVKQYFEKFQNIASAEDKNIKEEKLIKLNDIIKDILPESSDKKESLNNDQKLANINLNEINEEEKAEIQSIVDDVVKEIKHRLNQEHKISPKNYEILSRSSFIMLNNYFEYLLADLLNYFYNKYKDSLNDKEFKVTLKELSEFDNLDDAIKSFINKEVESIIVENTFNKLLEHFEKKLSIELENTLIDWKSITEIRERRHIIVHNSSIINKKYISRTGNPFKYKIGNEISIESDYFNDSLDQFNLAGLFLILNSWGEWDKSNIDRAIEILLDQSYDYLVQEKYNCVCKICIYSNKISARNEHQEDLLLRIKFNNALALKNLKETNQLNKVLKEIKVGTASPFFKIAHMVLQDNYDGIEELFRKAILLEEIDLEGYLEWPIFKWTRENKAIHEKVISFFDEKNTNSN